MIGGEDWAWAGHPPRRWQVEHVEALRRVGLAARPVCHVVMGAGKSIAIAELARRMVSRGKSVLLTVPSVKLVEQMRATCIRALGTRAVGCVYTHEHCPHRPLSIVCHDSIWRWRDSGGLADVWISDECHRTETPEMLAWSREHAPELRIGYSATPWLSDGERAISSFREVAYTYGPTEAVEDGVLVPWRVRCLPADGEDAWTLLQRMWQQWPPEGPGIVSASSIEDAETTARRMTDMHMPARAIHSRISQAERERIECDLESGKIVAAVHVNMLVEGADYPWLRWIALLRPSTTTVRFPQEVGRVLRAHDGKSHATIYDPHRLTDQYGMSYEAALGWATDVDPSETRDSQWPDCPWPLQVETAAAVTSGWRAWASMTLHDLDMSGIIIRRRLTEEARRMPCTPAQADAAAKALERFSQWRGPNEARDHVQDGLRRAAIHGLSQGDASDALTLYAAGLRGWRDAEHEHCAAS